MKLQALKIISRMKRTKKNKKFIFQKYIIYNQTKRYQPSLMRKRINFDLLKKNQLRAQYLKNPLQ